MLADPGLPAPSLNEAAARADLIMKGSVVSHEFRASDTLVRIKVSDVFKGANSSETAVIFPGRLQPYPDWETPAIGFLESAPIPKPKEELLLFLQSAPLEDGAYSPQAFTGLYVVSADRLEGLEGNPFADQVEALGLGALISQLSAETPVD